MRQLAGRVIALAVGALVVLHTVDGREIIVNPAQITTMREAHDADDPNRAFTEQVRCMINTADGKFVTVVEECEAIREMLK
ncbi:hypothetical protein NLM33_32770 [Bradyrhizobium sp. CCGUVB1N3]|uniref:hypothetical protein n=1 Tax=Bradyrhizobium sp. CCGUVB1N3 TaxID=2949629 RepID=UPI0020B396E9|nr:hypothetical protein [Bradyrhizobium sp. CCGUVB1N3]MCP3475098.1 hypothetical protein [Bradyrhizobium sp. CCGUVB1N3]